MMEELRSQPPLASAELADQSALQPSKLARLSVLIKDVARPQQSVQKSSDEDINYDSCPSEVYLTDVVPDSSVVGANDNEEALPNTHVSFLSGMYANESVRHRL